jgi:cobalt-zinc-cadmium resistance protein CzcA
MLERLVRLSIERRGIVLVVSLLLAVLGVAELRRLAIDAVPDVTNVQVSIQTSAAGLSPLEVEQYLTYPIEMALNGLPHLQQIRSVSRTGVSAVTVVFDDDADVWFARQLVAERLRQAEAEIPPGYGRPELGPVATGLGDIYEFVLRSDRHTPMELRTALDWIISPRLRQVPGVIEVNGLGGELKQFQVQVDPQQLAARGIPFNRVVDALRRNNRSVGGGYIERAGESLVIRGDALARSLADLGRIVLATDPAGTPVLLDQVAKVEIGPALRFGAATQGGSERVVTGTVMMLVGSNSRDVVGLVKEKIAEIQTELPEGMTIDPFYDRAEFIDRVLATVLRNLVEGAALVTLVMLVGLGTLPGALIAAAAIPFSMLLAVIGMNALGVVGNIMSLGAIDFGLLVDGAIIMLEAILAQLAVRMAAGQDRISAIADAAAQVARPVASSVTIILLVYLPLMALEGVEGKMFRPMAITVALALAGALFYTLVTFPAAISFVARPAKHGHDEGRIYSRIRAAYARALEWALARSGLTAGLAAAAFAGSLFLGTTLGADFVPRIFEGELVVDVRRIPSVAIGEAERLGQILERTLLRFPEAKLVTTRTGRGDAATDPVGPDNAEVMVKLAPRDEWVTTDDADVLAEKMKEAIEREVPGTFPSMSQPIEDRVNELMAGSRADVVVKLFGDDLEQLKDVADKIGAVLKDVPGTGDLRVQRVLGLPLLEVKADRTQLARHGLEADAVLEAVEGSVVGHPVGKIFEGSRRFDVVVKLPPSSPSEEGFASLLVGDERGVLVPLSQLVDIRRTEGPAVINRESLERRVLVESNVRGRDLVSYVQDARERVAQAVEIPEGVRVVWGGQFENFSRAAGRLALVVPIALAIIFGMLFLTFGDVRYTLAVFSCVAFSLIGGIVALVTRGLVFSIPAGVGFIALCGVAVLNGVVLASELKRRREGGEALETAVRAAALGALRPVLMTAGVAAIGFLPMAISSMPGSEVQRPLATVVIGGIVSGTVLTLLVLPIVLRRLCRNGA